MLNSLTPLIRKVIDGKDLTTEETKKLLVKVSKEDTEGYYYLAYASAVMTKGLSDNELLGLIEGLQEFSVKFTTKFNAEDIIDLSGTGGDKLKTFNVSTAASLILAASGIKVAKQSFKSFTSPIGSSKLLEELGINSPNTSKEIDQYLEKVGFAPINYALVYQGMEARHKATTKLRQIGLAVPTPMHPIAFVPHPLKIRRRVYGVFDEKYLLPLANLFKKLGYTKVMVIFGTDGLDEISVVGKTKIVELSGGKISEYTLTPNDLGLPTANIKDLSVESPEESITTFLRILYGKESGPKKDIVLANAAAGFLVMDIVKNIKEGVIKAREILEGGFVSNKLEELAKISGDSNKLQDWKKKANIF